MIEHNGNEGMNWEYRFWNAARAVLRALKPVALYLLFPAFVASIGMVISGRLEFQEQFVAQSGRFYKTLGLVLTFVFLEYRARKRGSTIAEEITLDVKEPDVRKLLYLFGIGLGISLALSAVFALLPDFLTESYRESAGSGFQGTDLWLAVISAVILAPILEEIIFRGYMLNRLFEGMEERTALIVSGVIFGLCHVSPLWVLYASAMGVFLSYIAVKEDNILYSIGLHVGFNFLSVPTLFLEKNPLRYEIIYENPLLTCALCLIGCLATCYCWKLYQNHGNGLGDSYDA